MTQSAPKASGVGLTASQQRPQQQQQQQAETAEYYGLYKTARTLAKSYQAVAHQKDDQVKALTREMEELKLKLQLMEAQQQQLQPGGMKSQSGTSSHSGANISCQHTIDAPLPHGSLHAHPSTADSLAPQLSARAMAAPPTARSSTQPQHNHNNVAFAKAQPFAAALRLPQHPGQTQTAAAAAPLQAPVGPRGASAGVMRRSADLHLLFSAQMLQRSTPSINQNRNAQPGPAPQGLQKTVSYREPAGAPTVAPPPGRVSSTRASADMWQVQVPEPDDLEDADIADGGKIKKAKGKLGAAFKKLMSKSWRSKEDTTGSGSEKQMPYITGGPPDVAAGGVYGGLPARGLVRRATYHGVGMAAVPPDGPPSLEPVMEDGMTYEPYDLDTTSGVPANLDRLNHAPGLPPAPQAHHAMNAHSAAAYKGHNHTSAPGHSMSVTLPSEYLLGAPSPQDQLAAAAAAATNSHRLHGAQPGPQGTGQAPRQLMQSQSMRVSGSVSAAQQQQLRSQSQRTLSTSAAPAAPQTHMLHQGRVNAPAAVPRGSTVSGAAPYGAPVTVDGSRTSAPPALRAEYANAATKSARHVSGGVVFDVLPTSAPASSKGGSRGQPGPCGSTASNGAGSDPSNFVEFDSGEVPAGFAAGTQQLQSSASTAFHPGASHDDTASRRVLKQSGSLKMRGEVGVAGGSQGSGGINWSSLVQRSGLGQMAARLRDSIHGTSRSTLERNSWDGGSTGGAGTAAGVANASGPGAGPGFGSSAGSIQSWTSDSAPHGVEAAPPQQSLGVRSSAPGPSSRNMLTASLSSLNLRAVAAHLANLPPRPAGAAAGPAGPAPAAAVSPGVARRTASGPSGSQSLPPGHPAAELPPAAQYGAAFGSCDLPLRPANPVAAAAPSASSAPSGGDFESAAQLSHLHANQAVPPGPYSQNGVATTGPSPSLANGAQPDRADRSRLRAAQPDAYLEGILGRLKTPSVLLGQTGSIPPTVTASWAGPSHRHSNNGLGAARDGYSGAQDLAVAQPQGAPEGVIAADITHGSAVASKVRVTSLPGTKQLADGTVLQRDFCRRVGVAWRHKSLGSGRTLTTAHSFHEKTLPRTSVELFSPPRAFVDSAAIAVPISEEEELQDEAFEDASPDAHESLLVPQADAAVPNISGPGHLPHEDMSSFTPRSHPVEASASSGGRTIVVPATSPPPTSSPYTLYGTGATLVTADAAGAPVSPGRLHAHEAALWRSTSPKARASARSAHMLTDRSPSPKSYKRAAAAAEAVAGRTKTTSATTSRPRRSISGLMAKAAAEEEKELHAGTLGTANRRATSNFGRTKQAATDPVPHAGAYGPHHPPGMGVADVEEEEEEVGADTTLWFAPSVAAVSSLSLSGGGAASAGGAGGCSGGGAVTSRTGGAGHGRYAAAGNDGDSSSDPSTGRSGTWSTEPSPRNERERDGEHEASTEIGVTENRRHNSAALTSSGLPAAVTLQADLAGGTVSARGGPRDSLPRRQGLLLAVSSAEDAALQSLPSARGSGSTPNPAASSNTKGAQGTQPSGTAVATASPRRVAVHGQGSDPSSTPGAAVLASTPSSSAAQLLKQNLADASAVAIAAPLSARKRGAVRRRSLAAGLEADGAGPGVGSTSTAGSSTKDCSDKTATSGVSTSQAHQDDTRRASDGGLIAPHSEGSATQVLQEPPAAPRTHHRRCAYEGETGDVVQQEEAVEAVALDRTSRSKPVATSTFRISDYTTGVKAGSTPLHKTAGQAANVISVATAVADGHAPAQEAASLRSSVCLVSAPHAQSKWGKVSETQLVQAAEEAESRLREEERKAAAIRIQRAWRARKCLRNATHVGAPSGAPLTASVATNVTRPATSAVPTPTLRIFPLPTPSSARATANPAAAAVRTGPTSTSAAWRPEDEDSSNLGSPPRTPGGGSTQGGSTTGPPTPVLVLHPLSQQQPVCVRLPSARLCMSGGLKRRLFATQRRTSMDSSLEHQQVKQILESGGVGPVTGPDSSHVRFWMLRGGGQSDGGWLGGAGYYTEEGMSLGDGSKRSSLQESREGLAALRYPPVPKFVLPAMNGDSKFEAPLNDDLSRVEAEGSCTPAVQEPEPAEFDVTAASPVSEISGLGPLPQSPLSPPSPFPEAADARDEFAEICRDVSPIQEFAASRGIAPVTTTATVTDAIVTSTLAEIKQIGSHFSTVSISAEETPASSMVVRRTPSGPASPSSPTANADTSLQPPPPLPSASPAPKVQPFAASHAWPPSPKGNSPLLFCTEVMTMAAQVVSGSAGVLSHPGRRSCMGALLGGPNNATDGSDAPAPSLAASLLARSGPSTVAEAQQAQQRRGVSASWDCFSSLGELRHGLLVRTSLEGTEGRPNRNSQLRASDGSQGGHGGSGGGAASRADVALLAQLAAAAMDSCLGTSTAVDLVQKNGQHLSSAGSLPAPLTQQPHAPLASQLVASVKASTEADRTPDAVQQPATLTAYDASQTAVAPAVTTSSAGATAPGLCDAATAPARTLQAQAVPAVPSDSAPQPSAFMEKMQPPVGTTTAASSRRNTRDDVAEVGSTGPVTGRSDLSDIPPDLMLGIPIEHEDGDLSSLSLLGASFRSQEHDLRGASVEGGEAPRGHFSRLSLINIGSPPEGVGNAGRIGGGCANQESPAPIPTTSPVRWHTSQLWEMVNQAQPTTPPPALPLCGGGLLSTGGIITAGLDMGLGGSTTASGVPLSRRSWPCSQPPGSSASASNAADSVVCRGGAITAAGSTLSAGHLTPLMVATPWSLIGSEPCSLVGAAVSGRATESDDFSDVALEEVAAAEGDILIGGSRMLPRRLAASVHSATHPLLLNRTNPSPSPGRDSAADSASSGDGVDGAEDDTAAAGSAWRRGGYYDTSMPDASAPAASPVRWHTSQLWELVHQPQLSPAALSGDHLALLTPRDGAVRNVAGRRSWPGVSGTSVCMGSAMPPLPTPAGAASAPSRKTRSGATESSAMSTPGVSTELHRPVAPVDAHEGAAPSAFGGFSLISGAPLNSPSLEPRRSAATRPQAVPSSTSPTATAPAAPTTFTASSSKPQAQAGTPTSVQGPCASSSAAPTAAAPPCALTNAPSATPRTPVGTAAPAPTPSASAVKTPASATPSARPSPQPPMSGCSTPGDIDVSPRLGLPPHAGLDAAPSGGEDAVCHVARQAQAGQQELKAEDAGLQDTQTAAARQVAAVSCYLAGEAVAPAMGSLQLVLSGDEDSVELEGVEEEAALSDDDSVQLSCDSSEGGC